MSFDCEDVVNAAAAARLAVLVDEATERRLDIDDDEVVRGLGGRGWLLMLLLDGRVVLVLPLLEMELLVVAVVVGAVLDADAACAGWKNELPDDDEVVLLLFTCSLLSIAMPLSLICCCSIDGVRMCDGTMWPPWTPFMDVAGLLNGSPVGVVLSSAMIPSYVASVVVPLSISILRTVSLRRPA